MQRKILIIDDHDDLASALRRKFDELGYEATVFDNRPDAVDASNLHEYDITITDLDNIERAAELGLNGSGPAKLEILPETCIEKPEEIIKAFKISAANYDRENFDEAELKQLVDLTLDYKAKFVDEVETVQNLREMIEFELPSAISLMHSILDYLMKRTEKVGVVNAESSNLFIALDEAFVNAVKHGNRYNHEKLVRISAEVSTKEVRFTVEDEGEGFKLSEIPDPLNVENLFKTSGRGVLLIHNIMDEVEYNERGNRLTMVKKKDPVS
jgi:serine/threonine-protein kinase RsbW